MLHVDGSDIIGEPNVKQRRALLPKVTGKNPVIRVSDDLPGSASQVLEAVWSLGLEGVIAKRQGSTYQAGPLKAALRHAAFLEDTAGRLRSACCYNCHPVGGPVAPAVLQLKWAGPDVSISDRFAASV